MAQAVIHVSSKNIFAVSGSKDLQGKGEFHCSRKPILATLDTGDVFEFSWSVGTNGWAAVHRKSSGMDMVTKQTQKNGECLLQIKGEFTSVELKPKEDK